MPEIQNAPIAGLLDRIVIGKSLETFAKWTKQKKVPQDFFISVNVSRHSLLSDDVVGYLQSALEKLSIPPEQLILEVSGCGPGMDVQVFSGIKQLGVKIAMDDVGLKYGNFELYANIQPDYAKLDQRRIDESRNPQALADQENRLSVLWQSLGLEIIAKSIESADQIGKLAGRGITLVQGYVFDQPRDAGEFVEYWGLHTPDDELPTQLRKTG
jgi:EAL domain-containing protein (putative c-di-GMP-specific phosphodiesterase class I)